jgi:hypothetical protein
MVTYCGCEPNGFDEYLRWLWGYGIFKDMSIEWLGTVGQLARSRYEELSLQKNKTLYDSPSLMWH